MFKLVLMRHGESQWNLENRFTGWADVDLTLKGCEEAKKAGQLLKANHFEFDIAYTSVLKRAIRTLWFTLDELDQMYTPIIHSWRLNERHYGNLQGLNKTETAQQYGEEQVLLWRRSYSIAPAPMGKKDPRYAGNDRRYSKLNESQIPLSECLKDTVDRVIPLWNDSIAPAIRTGKQVIVAAHGNSLRALIKHIDQISEEGIMQLNIPTAQPLVYEFDDQLNPLRNYYLGNAEEIASAMSAVANQGKASAKS